jgi:chromosome segregation ATPase
MTNNFLNQAFQIVNTTLNDYKKHSFENISELLEHSLQNDPEGIVASKFGTKENAQALFSKIQNYSINQLEEIYYNVEDTNRSLSFKDESIQSLKNRQNRAKNYEQSYIWKELTVTKSVHLDSSYIDLTKKIISVFNGLDQSNTLKQAFNDIDEFLDFVFASALTRDVNVHNALFNRFQQEYNAAVEFLGAKMNNYSTEDQNAIIDQHQMEILETPTSSTTTNAAPTTNACNEFFAGDPVSQAIWCSGKYFTDLSKNLEEIDQLINSLTDLHFNTNSAKDKEINKLTATIATKNEQIRTLVEEAARLSAQTQNINEQLQSTTSANAEASRIIQEKDSEIETLRKQLDANKLEYETEINKANTNIQFLKEAAENITPTAMNVFEQSNRIIKKRKLPLQVGKQRRGLRTLI